MKNHAKLFVATQAVEVWRLVLRVSNIQKLDWFVRRIQDRLVQAIRAVEWELQQSLVDPREVMTTYDVEDLRVLANELRNAVLQGRVAGGNPTQGIFTLSLTELLDVRDPED
ncbi:MAG: hypothetical protein AAFX94_15010, partial [Myxococcota bacterium]